MSLWQLLAGRELCEKRAARESAMIREAIGPALLPAGRIESIGDGNDCDSSSYGAWVDVGLRAEAREEDVVAGFLRAGWSGAGASELTRTFGHRVVGVSVETRSGRVEISAVAVDDCWDDHGYRCG
ncbi:hypothetical protein ACWENQ_10390 [Nonomuraea sp. NPDC004354]